MRYEILAPIIFSILIYGVSQGQPEKDDIISILDTVDNYVFEARRLEMAISSAEKLRKATEERHAISIAKLKEAKENVEQAEKALSAILKIRRAAMPFSITLSSLIGVETDDMLRRSIILEKLAVQEAKAFKTLVDARNTALVADFITGMERANAYAVAKVEIEAKQKLEEDVARKRNLLQRIENDPNLWAKYSSEKEDVERKLILNIRSRLTKMPGPVDFDKMKGRVRWPLMGASVDKTFGNQVHPVFKTTVPHPGVTLVFWGVERRNVRAVGFGKVVFLSQIRGLGLTVVLDHASGWYSVYAGLGEVFVKEGQVVREGDVIGIVERLPGENGVRLYFELRHDENPVNPLLYFQKVKKKKEIQATHPPLEPPKRIEN